MANLPTVAIIGRPNTGKSTLFNRLVGRRTAIVSQMPGTTRDHVSYRVEGEKVDYLLLDTGGMGGGTEDADFEDDVHAQSLLALENADVILFVVNSREELTASDYEVVNTLRTRKRKHVPVFLIVSKCDDPEKLDEMMPRFAEVDIAQSVIPISAVHGLGIAEMEQKIEDTLLALHFSKEHGHEQGEAPRIAIVGRPNVGKSSMINALMSDPQRNVSPLLTSDIPGTTRDSIDTLVKFRGKEYILVDTAGLRRHSKVKEDVEAYSVLRTIRAVEQADVTVLVLDPKQGITKQDKHIAGMAIERGSGLIIIVNKIDTIDSDEKNMMRRELARCFPFCKWAPVLFCSAQTKENLTKIFEVIEDVAGRRTLRIPTAELNRWFEDVRLSQKGQQLSVGKSGSKYITQVGEAPPTFAVFLRDPSKLSGTTLRFVENRLRESFPLDGVPVRWLKKAKERS